MIRVVDTTISSPAEILKTVRRPAPDEMEVSPRVMAKTQQIFQRALTPKEAVTQIVSDIRTKGDEALLDYARRIDGVELTASSMWVTQDELAQAKEEVSDEFLDALTLAVERIRSYHRQQLPNSWWNTDAKGVILGQKYTPLRVIGAYVPGGTAPLVSSLLMSCIPAQVAGVKEIVVATPAHAQGGIDPHILTAAEYLGIERVLKIGGAQAIAALAFGTETVPQVDKIVGPGNIFVTLAKKQVFGHVGIDMLAGPSEIMIIADEGANPVWVAADLLSQAEHDTDAAAVLVTPVRSLGEQVQRELAKQVDLLGRKEWALEALKRWGLIVYTKDLIEAAEVANLFAPEHLELCVADPFGYLEHIHNAGAIFLGNHTSESLGDYVAGPNHILPTNGSARFSSCLDVFAFVKRSSIIYYTEEALGAHGPKAAKLADVEGLQAHANAVRIRLDKGGA
ncbi:MAG: histidinol dehydrogenase [Limnochordia bacterium]|jgi:histidinol dehydrogenase|nr:histidinol dehydrogenase [Limnochordia bacterium]MDD2628987.1 histidinol dehydrogenase [Limnochordia bacterium]